jgi:hypothetical protein
MDQRNYIQIKDIWKTNTSSSSNAPSNLPSSLLSK